MDGITLLPRGMKHKFAIAFAHTNDTALRIAKPTDLRINSDFSQGQAMTHSASAPQPWLGSTKVRFT